VSGNGRRLSIQLRPSSSSGSALRPWRPCSVWRLSVPRGWRTFSRGRCGISGSTALCLNVNADARQPLLGWLKPRVARRPRGGEPLGRDGRARVAGLTVRSSSGFRQAGGYTSSSYLRRRTDLRFVINVDACRNATAAGPFAMSALPGQYGIHMSVNARLVPRTIGGASSRTAAMKQQRRVDFMATCCSCDLRTTSTAGSAWSAT